MISSRLLKSIGNAQVLSQNSSRIALSTFNRFKPNPVNAVLQSRRFIHESNPKLNTAVDPAYDVKQNIGKILKDHQQNQAANTAQFPPHLEKKIAQFISDVNAHLPADGKGVSIATAWLNTDNVIVALLHHFFPRIFEGLEIVAVDTLHLFPETLAVAKEIQERFGKVAIVTKPLNCASIEDFVHKYGDCEKMSISDFDYHSKVEPFGRGLEVAKKRISITGRRVDQGNVRTELAIFEKDKQTFNPLSNWSWQDITDFVTLTQLPYNRKHDIIYRSETPIPATQRHLPGLPWKAINLGKPYWTATQSELQGFPAAKYVYVWKSFGDHHTSVPVHAEESERSGRFVRNVGKTECGIHTRSTSKGQPHGGVLVDLMEKDTEKRASLIASCDNRVIELDERGACDVELLINGGFSPLRGFMTEHEYNHVVQHMRLPELQLFAMPIVLHTNSESLKVGQNVLLKFKDDLGGESRPLAVLTIQSKWIPNKPLEAKNVLGTTAYDHPGVQEITERGKYYLGGRIFGLDFPRRTIECKTPRELRSEFSEQKDIVAFQCRNPVHRAHYELFSRVPSQIDNSVVLVHPTCGPTQDGDIDWRLRFKTYEALQQYVPNPSIKWAYLPYSMKMAGPREAIQHMIIRKNYGATHFIIGRDMAGCKSTISGEDFYGPYDAQKFAEKHEAELGIKVVPFKQLVFTKEKGYIEKEEAEKLKIKALSLSGTEFRKRLKTGEEIPEWFAFPAVVKVLRESAVAEE